MSLVMSSVVPLTIYCFTVGDGAGAVVGAVVGVATHHTPSCQPACPQIPMPFLPPSPPLGKWFGLGTVTLLLGLLLFNAPVLLPALRKAAAETAGGRAKKE